MRPATFQTPTSLEGSSLREFAEDTRAPRTRGKMRIAPRPAEGIPPGMCKRCGFPGPHADADECIGALRDRLAERR